MNSEQIASAAYNMQAAARDMLRAADTISESTARLERLFGQGYGTNIDLLIEALHRNAPPIEPTKTSCVCGFCDGSDCNPSR